MKPIATVLPARDAGTGRFERLGRCLESWTQQSEGLSTLFVLLDQDDVANYHEIIRSFSNTQLDIKFILRPAGISLMEKINPIGVRLAGEYELIAFLGDDVVLRTPWESKFLNYLRSVPAGVVYGNTLEPHPEVWWATHPCISSNLIRAVGFYGCPAVKHNCFDVYWSHIGLGIGHFKNFEDVIMDHRRSMKDVDALWRSVVNLQQSDRESFEIYKRENLQSDLSKIRAVINF